MSKRVLIDGDRANFTSSFGAATVVVRPGILKASGPATVNGRKVCVAGDESSAKVRGCMYKTMSHPIPGIGTLQIKSLDSSQTAQKTRSGNKLVLLVGKSFKARFMVQTPAKQPTAAGPVPDANTEYSGTGTFATRNKKFRGV